jgi:hypothetical protein
MIFVFALARCQHLSVKCSSDGPVTETFVLRKSGLFLSNMSKDMAYSFFVFDSVVNLESRFSESRMSLCVSRMASRRVLGPMFVRLSGLSCCGKCRMELLL